MGSSAQALCTWQCVASDFSSWRLDEAMVCFNEGLLFFSFVINADWHCCGSKCFVVSRSKATFWVNAFPALTWPSTDFLRENNQDAD